MSAAIIAPMAIAYLYKAFANPAERKQKEIHNKLQDLEEGIRKVLQGAKETQAATLDAVVNEFYSAAEWYLVPLVHSSRRAVDIVSLQERLIEQSVENTIGSLESLRLV